jgi:hypothetical protein
MSALTTSACPDAAARDTAVAPCSSRTHTLRGGGRGESFRHRARDARGQRDGIHSFPTKQSRQGTHWQGQAALRTILVWAAASGWQGQAALRTILVWVAASGWQGQAAHERPTATHILVPSPHVSTAVQQHHDGVQVPIGSCYNKGRAAALKAWGNAR